MQEMMIDIGHMMFLYLPILMIFFICVLFAHAGSKSYQEAHRALSYKACTTEGAVHCTKVQLCRPYGEGC